MLRGEARHRARRVGVRRLIAAGVLAGAAVALAPGGAGADGCLITPFGPCPGTAPAPTTTSTTVVKTPTTTAAPRPAPTMTAAQAAARLLALVNGERTERGLPFIEARNDVSGIVMQWSAAMTRHGEPSHNDAYFSSGFRRSRTDQQQAAALALLGVIVVGAVALRRWAVQKVLRARQERRPADALAPHTDLTVEDDDDIAEARHHLAVISSWARTLEDRWATMSANDKRIAMQVIGRNAEEALADLARA